MSKITFNSEIDSLASLVILPGVLSWESEASLDQSQKLRRADSRMSRVVLVGKHASYHTYFSFKNYPVFAL